MIGRRSLGHITRRYSQMPLPSRLFLAFAVYHFHHVVCQTVTSYGTIDYAYVHPARRYRSNLRFGRFSRFGNTTWMMSRSIRRYCGRCDIPTAARLIIKAYPQNAQHQSHSLSLLRTGNFACRWRLTAAYFAVSNAKRLGDYGHWTFCATVFVLQRRCTASLYVPARKIKSLGNPSWTKAS